MKEVCEANVKEKTDGTALPVATEIRITRFEVVTKSSIARVKAWDVNDNVLRSRNSDHDSQVAIILGLSRNIPRSKSILPC